MSTGRPTFNENTNPIRKLTLGVSISAGGVILALGFTLLSIFAVATGGVVWILLVKADHDEKSYCSANAEDRCRELHRSVDDLLVAAELENEQKWRDGEQEENSAEEIFPE